MGPKPQPPNRCQPNADLMVSWQWPRPKLHTLYWQQSSVWTLPLNASGRDSLLMCASLSLLPTVENSTVSPVAPVDGPQGLFTSTGVTRRGPHGEHATCQCSFAMECTVKCCNLQCTAAARSPSRVGSNNLAARPTGEAQRCPTEAMYKFRAHSKLLQNAAACICHLLQIAATCSKLQQNEGADIPGHWVCESLLQDAVERENEFFALTASCSKLQQEMFVHILCPPWFAGKCEGAHSCRIDFGWAVGDCTGCGPSAPAPTAAPWCADRLERYCCGGTVSGGLTPGAGLF
eukprot:gene5904-biopygen16315